MKYILLVVTTTLGLCSLHRDSRADEPLRPERALKWKPRPYPEAVLHGRIPFLQPNREWERLDVWVPREPAKGKLPCVIAVYGGGYGDKMGGFINDARPILKRGFVVAAPDYALQTDAPVPLCAWDVANAIRYLRANADKYRIDPERIGVWGWSAGGWIAQDLCYAGPQRVVYSPKKVDRKKTSRWFPMLEPKPRWPEQSIRVQAVVTDWGAGKLWNRRTMAASDQLTADDPPLFTCYNGDYAKDRINPVMMLQKLGVPSRAVYDIKGNTHVPSLKTAAVHENGDKTTWGESIYDFFDRELKSPTVATAPEMRPHGGPISGPTNVQLLTVHSTGTIHYTLDGTEPTSNTMKYKMPIAVKPGQTIRAIVIRPGLKPSRITTGHFALGSPSPIITTKARAFQATVGKPFRVAFTANNADDASWFVGGKTGAHYRNYNGQRFNPPRHIPWMSINPKTGVLSGVPRRPGVYPAIVSCAVATGNKKKIPAIDAVLIVVTVAKNKKNARVSDGNVSLTLRGHKQAVTSVAFTPDGKRIVTGGADDSLRVWDARSGTLIATMAVGGKGVTALAVSPGGKRIVCGTWKGRLVVWSIAAKKKLLTLHGHRENVTSVAYSPDGKRIASGSGDDTLRIWNAQTGKQIMMQKLDNEYDVTAVSFSPDGMTIVSGDGESALTIWDLRDGQELAFLEGHRLAVTSAAFSPDGKYIVSGSQDDTARVWDVRGEREILTLRGHRGDVLSVAFSPDGKQIFTGSDDKAAKIWSTVTGKCLATLPQHKARIAAIAVSPDGRRIATAAGNVVKIWRSAALTRITNR